MRSFQRPAVRITTTDAQRTFRALSRHRRTKLARTAQTTLLKADQWSRGDATPPALASALDRALKTLTAKAPAKA
ncbi:MAG: hypothetical protein WBY94_15575 [Polyangiaceae bacterium]